MITKQKIKYFIYTIKTKIKKILILILMYLSIQFLVGGMILTGYGNFLNNLVTKVSTNHPYDKDIKTCLVTSCKSLKKSNGVILKSVNNKLVESTEFNDTFIISFYKNVHFNSDFELVIYNETNKTLYILDTSEIKEMIIEVVSILSLLLLLISIYFIVCTVKEEREASIISLAGNEALLGNRSMILITENIHHELNTPMEVIDNKVYKIQKLIKEYTEHSEKNKNQFRNGNDRRTQDRSKFKGVEKRTMNQKLLQIDADFEFIKQSSEQIYAILERMKGFKQIKYSNGNKSIANIIEGAFKVISISNSNFSYDVDKELRNYTIYSEEFKNADLLNILINHFKNSLEANSNKIHISFTGFKEPNLRLRIIDNGNGIPEKSRKDIFKPDFSTKQIGNSGIRGNGLYLNKSILKASAGDVKLIDTSSYGTTFELSIPAKSGVWKRLYD